MTTDTMGFRKENTQFRKTKSELERLAAPLIWRELTKKGATVPRVAAALGALGIRKLKFVRLRPEAGTDGELYGGVMIECSYVAEWDGQPIEGHLSRGIVARMPK